MKLRLLLLIFIVSLVSSCRFSSDPPPKPEYYNYRGLWQGTMEALPSHKKFAFSVNVLSQALYGSVTGEWQADFPDGKISGTMQGTTRKDGVHFSLKIPNSLCDLGFSGANDGETITGIMRNYQPKQCEQLKYGEGTLKLQHKQSQ